MFCNDPSPKAHSAGKRQTALIPIRNAATLYGATMETTSGDEAASPAQTMRKHATVMEAAPPVTSSCDPRGGVREATMEESSRDKDGVMAGVGDDCRLSIPSMTSVDDDVDEDDNGRTGAKAAAEKRRREEISILAAAVENRVVKRGRILVLTVLLLATVGVALTVYFLASSTERKQFENDFEEFADKVLLSLGGNLELTLGAIDSLVVTMVVSCFALVGRSAPRTY